MIIGRGLIASAFNPQIVSDLDATIYASGVSDSSQDSQEAFARETVLLEQHLGKARGCFVYFGTCNVHDPDRMETPYTKHKLRMEAMVMRGQNYAILRLPQVVGATGNPSNLLNHLTASIRAEREIQVWRLARRTVIDVADVAKLTHTLLERGPMQLVSDLAPPESVTVLELIDILERVLGAKARKSLVDRGNDRMPDSTLAVDLSNAAGIDFSPGYTERTIGKYYGKNTAQEGLNRRSGISQ